MFRKFKKTRQVRFAVTFRVHDLTNIPLINGILFVKWKLQESGKISGMTKRAPISDHFVRWDEKFEFESSMAVDKKTAVLCSEFAVFSVCMETEGGTATALLGVVQVDLAEYASVPSMTRRYLLKRSQLNSTLGLSISMVQTAGEPFFRLSESVTAKVLSLSANDGASSAPSKTSNSSLRSNSDQSDQLLQVPVITTSSTFPLDHSSRNHKRRTIALSDSDYQDELEIVQNANGVIDRLFEMHISHSREPSDNASAINAASQNGSSSDEHRGGSSTAVAAAAAGARGSLRSSASVNDVASMH